MGGLCSKCIKSKKKNYVRSSSETEEEKEIILYSYKSKPDKEYQKLETQYNLLRDIDFQDYMYSLVEFDMSNATLKDDYSKANATYNYKDSFFKEPLSVDYFQSFLENKIIKHPALYIKTGNDENLKAKFEDMFLYIYKSLQSKLIQFDKEKGVTDNTESRLKKGHCMVIGLLFCSGANISKIRFIFDLFKEDNILKESEELKEFLLSMYLTASYCVLFSRNKLGINNSDIPALEKEVMFDLLKTSEAKDSVNLVKVTINKLFGKTNELTYEAYVAMFSREKESMGWLISTKGIRSALEENNV